MKAATLVPKKLRSVRSPRDKNGSHGRNKSSEPGFKPRPLTSETLLSIFRPESSKQAQKEKGVENGANEVDKIANISRRLAELNYHNISDEYVRYALHSPFSEGDIDKAVEFLQLQQKAFSGIIEPYKPNVTMQGAENRGMVTCYLDALLFAMFAKLSAFECMLKNDMANEAQRKLAGLLRLWVNMLRSGYLLHADMTERIQEALADCGWKEAIELQQQDTSEAFAFITETLQLPLLALQVDLFHQGKKDVDDHKVVHERLLNLSVPPETEGKGIKLEDCLEEYFNSKVDVLRDSWEDKKEIEVPAIPLKDANGTARTLKLDDETNRDVHAHAVLQRRWTTQDSIVASPASAAMNGESELIGAPSSATAESRPHPRHRSTSIIQRIIVDNKGRPTESDSNSVSSETAEHARPTVVKAVTIPAWQFFRLIPWHTASNSEPKTNDEVVRHFNQKPVVGICLKRYAMTEQGVVRRHNTMIDIPDSLRLPHFMFVDDTSGEQDPNGLSQEYKLVLQSVVCHRGDSVHHGHYVSFARVAPKILTDNRRHDHDPPPDYEEAQWVKFDDLLVERVNYVDDIQQALREEMPYLLFYQIVPMVDVTTASTDGSIMEPPSYDANMTGNQTPTTDITMLDTTESYFDNTSTLVPETGRARLSSELDRSLRMSCDEDPRLTHLKSYSSRSGSTVFSEATAPTPAIHPETPSSAANMSQDESTAARLSRAAARFTKTSAKSRPSSQAGEGRISLTMTRLGGLVRSSREPLRGEAPSDSEGAEDQQSTIAKEEASTGKDREKDHHYLHRKSRGKAKSRDKDEKKEKIKGKDKPAVPDRECIVI